MASKFRTTYGKGVAVELMSNSIDNGSLAHLSREHQRERERTADREPHKERECVYQTLARRQVCQFCVIMQIPPPRSALIDK